MKTKYFIALYLTVFFSLTDMGLSADTSSVKFMPLQIGNVWVYQRTDYNTKYRVEVKRDTVINGHKYYYLFNSPYLGTGWVRVDSTTGSLMKFILSSPCSSSYFQEMIIDSLGARNIGLFTANCLTGNGLWDTSIVTILGIPRKTKQFGMPGYHTSYCEKYSRDIGLYSYTYCFYQPYGCYTYNLVGAFIDGVLYGDTSGASSIVGLEPVNIRLPEKFNLYQNYPNPFNPVTKIKFDVSKTSYTKVIIYNILGREVARLVNEELKPGTYETEWNAADFSSGIYFYKITAGDYTETKKMVLMK